MKKLMLVIAVLATLTISLTSFIKLTSAKDPTEYVWIRWGCNAYGSPDPHIGYYLTTDPGMLQGNCPENQPSGVCAVRFIRGTEATCDHVGSATILPGVNIWSSGRMIKYCTR